MRLFAIIVFILGDTALLVRTFYDRGSLHYPLLLSQVLASALLVLLAILLFQTLRASAPAVASEETATPPENAAMAAARTAGWMALCIVYISLWNLIGYLPSTIAFMVGMLLLTRERNPFVLAGMCLVFPGIIWLVFIRVLHLPLP